MGPERRQTSHSMMNGNSFSSNAHSSFSLSSSSFCPSLPYATRLSSPAPSPPYYSLGEQRGRLLWRERVAEEEANSFSLPFGRKRKKQHGSEFQSLLPSAASLQDLSTYHAPPPALSSSLRGERNRGRERGHDEDREYTYLSSSGPTSSERGEEREDSPSLTEGQTTMGTFSSSSSSSRGGEKTGRGNEEEEREPSPLSSSSSSSSLSWSRKVPPAPFLPPKRHAHPEVTAQIPNVHLDSPKVKKQKAPKPANSEGNPTSAEFRRFLSKICKVDGCQKKAKVKGVCVSHGAVVKRCEVPGCTKQIVNSGLCVAHGARVKRCSVKNCPKVAVNMGSCIAHGATVKRCSFPDCKRYAQLRGRCITHGGGIKRPCTVGGCEKYAKRGGKCLQHSESSADKREEMKEDKGGDEGGGEEQGRRKLDGGSGGGKKGSGRAGTKATTVGTKQ